MSPRDSLAPFKKETLPAFPGWWAALGPGIIWLALAQGSAELIWWPYLIAKYGLAFLAFLIPACLLQYPLNYEIGMYTLLTGESIFQGFIRLHRGLAFFLWVLMTLSFFWFGAFAAAGGTALAALTQFPEGWGARGQTLFWTYSSMAVFFIALLFSKVIYTLIEKMMWAIAVITLVGLAVACSHQEVLAKLPDFLRGVFIPEIPLPRPWDPKDATRLLTAVSFAGLGGFWTLFYSYWLREKGVGMAHYSGPMPGLLRESEGKGKGYIFHGKGDRHLRSLSPFPSLIRLEKGRGCGKGDSPHKRGQAVTPTCPLLGGLYFEGGPQERPEIKKWKRFLLVDSGIGIFGNIVTTLMTCLLAYALLFPEGLLPEKYEIAVVQARFFEVRWGVAGRFLFLFVAAAFLSDTWLATLDAVARIQTDFFHSFFPTLRRFSVKACYRFFAVLLTIITSVTVLLSEPGALILLSAVIGFIGTVIFSIAVWVINHRLLPKTFPEGAVAGKKAAVLLAISCGVYFLLAVVYFGVSLF